MPTETLTNTSEQLNCSLNNGDQPASQASRKPIQPTGALKHFEHEDLTPAIGRQYHHVNIVEDLMNAENADERLRELAFTSKVTLHGGTLLREAQADIVVASSLATWRGLLQ